MALLMISKIPCVQYGSTTHYDLDTKLFNESIFKMCTHCGVFAYDFAEFFCNCGRKLDFVDVSDMDALRLWLNNLDLNDNDKKQKLVESEKIESESDNDDSSTDSNPLNMMDETHVCYNGEDCSNSDCIDCKERQWEGKSSSDIDGDDVYDNGFYETYHECGSECGSECGVDCDIDNYDGWDENDSVS
jgi:hypothetical protein